MNAYTVSHLALDAGVSVHVVRDYMLRGLLRPAAGAGGGYCFSAPDALDGLWCVRAALRAVTGLDAWGGLCRGLDAADGEGGAVQLAVLRQLVERRREALASLEMQLAAMPTEPAQHAESLP